jgi:heme A synthase
MVDAAPPLPRLRTADSARLARALGRGCVALVTLTTGLIVLGALVRAHGAGLACPDWPLCFGTLLPRINLEVGFEWTHRLVAGTVSLGFLGLAAALLRAGALRRRVAAPLALAAGLLALQVVLGALTVWRLLAAWTVTAHLVVGNSFNACLLLVALRLREVERPPAARAPAPRAARAALLVATALLLLQFVLGGLVSSTHAGMACPEWPRCNGGAWLPSLGGLVGLHLAHRWNAVLLVAGLGAAALASRRVPGLAAICGGALALGLAQTGLGVANVLLAIPVEITALHSACAALLVLALTAALHAAFGKGSSLAL